MVAYRLSSEPLHFCSLSILDTSGIVYKDLPHLTTFNAQHVRAIFRDGRRFRLAMFVRLIGEGVSFRAFERFQWSCRALNRGSEQPRRHQEDDGLRSIPNMEIDPRFRYLENVEQRSVVNLHVFDIVEFGI